MIDHIFIAFEATEDAIEDFMTVMSRIDFMESLDMAHTGVSATEAPMFFLANNDDFYATLVLVGADGESYQFRRHRQCERRWYHHC